MPLSIIISIIILFWGIMYNIIQQERLYGINYSIQQNIDILYTPLIVSGAIVLIFKGHD